MKTFLIATGSILVSGVVFSKFVAKQPDGSGFVPVADGVGADDVVHALMGAAVFTLAAKFLLKR